MEKENAILSPIDIKAKSAGTPNIVSTLTVIIFIGIDNPNGCTIKLYPYSKKELIIIRFSIFIITFNIKSPNKCYEQNTKL